ncbi:MAG: energy-coupling factor ABC transporter ATP-binding protein [Anaerohalosphaera sp.]|nr:energy-coupling factor ABC transporter ATP-binding protein [Anaerohalosphaera sp.]
MPNAITVKNFSYSYPDGTDALSDISLAIEHGEKVGLIGPNGAGKSTILLAINMFIKGTGLIEVDGIEAVQKNARNIRTVINSVLQDPDEQLFMPTLYDDVAFGPLNMGLSNEDVDKRTIDALSKVGLGGMEKKMPHHISAGQKRAAAIATVLSMEPKVITMDEPDTSLDPANRKKLIGLLSSLDQTLVIATCSMNFAADLCKRVILVDGGKIIADGPAEKIMTDTQLMESHGLEVPMRYYRRPADQ